ncbi:toxin VasX [Tenacibaculum ascidiaceicola]|uniref:toxin VasX n=1 Tax=Tenacibaculum ascidiaceicola TaxID=1699411 RepID=UPI0039E85E8C
MANDILEKNQLTEYNEVVARYFFECTGGGVTEPVKSPEKEALKPGIRLHFLRYGLFDKNSESQTEEDVDAPKYNDPRITKGVLIQDDKAVCKNVATCNSNTQNTNTAENSTLELEEVEVLSLKELPDIDNFYVARTVLNKGYIYLINDEDQDDYHELYVDESGQLQHIIWAYNKDEKGNYKDIRKPSGDKSEYKLIIESGKKYWVAYSPVQWSRDYHNELNTDANKRKERMKLIDCSGIKKGEEEKHENVISFTNVRATFPGNHPRAGALEKMLDSILSDEKKQDEKGDNEVFEDMFITLHDPAGCAADISEVVSEKTLKLQALTQAIQSGESVKEALGRLERKEIQAPEPKDKEYGHLFTLALTCYQMVYNDDKAILKFDGGSPGWFNFDDRHSLDPRPMYSEYYSMAEKGMVYRKNSGHIGYGLDHEKLKGILGVEERKQARKILLNYREDLGVLLSSTYVRTYLDDFLGNHPERIVEGRDFMLNIIDPLSYHPYKFDRHLLLKKDYVENDKWVNWLYDVIDDKYPERVKNKETKSKAKGFEGLDPLLALLAAPLNINEVLSKGESFSQKIAGVYKKNLKYHAEKASSFKEVDGILLKSIEERQKFIVEKLNKNLKVFGEEMFEIIDGDIHLRLQELGVELDPEYVKKGKYTGKRADVLRILKESHGKDGFTYRTRKKGKSTTYEIKVKVVENVSDDARAVKNYKLSKIVNGRAFNGVFALLEVYNFSMAVVKVAKEGSTTKDFVYSLGAAVKLSEASMSLAKVTIISEEAAKKLSVRFASNTLTVLGGVVTMGWCLYDSFNAMDKGDMDAGFAMMGAGVAFGISSMASLGIVFASTGPVGWIAAAIGVGLLIIASLLTDSELETFFKNFLLSDSYGKGFPKKSDELPMDYARRILILENRKLLTDDDYHDTLMNPLDAQAKLFDCIVCKQIGFKPINSKTEIYTSYSPYGGGASSIETASYFSSKMVFSRFFNHPNQVETHIFFYPKGVKNGNPINMNVGTVNKIYDAENREALEVKFWVPKSHEDKITSQSEAVFALRLKVDENQQLYFPYSLQKKERYLGAKIKLRALSAGLYITDLDQNEDVTIAPLEELKTDKPW